jgi:hypothetical protein
MHGCYPSYAGPLVGRTAASGLLPHGRLRVRFQSTKQQRADAEALELEGEESERYPTIAPCDGSPGPCWLVSRRWRGCPFLSAPLISPHARQILFLLLGAAPMTGTPTANQPPVRFCFLFESRSAVSARSRRTSGHLGMPGISVP